MTNPAPQLSNSTITPRSRRAPNPQRLKRKPRSRSNEKQQSITSNTVQQEDFNQYTVEEIFEKHYPCISGEINEHVREAFVQFLQMPGIIHRNLCCEDLLRKIRYSDKVTVNRKAAVVDALSTYKHNNGQRYIRFVVQIDKNEVEYHLPDSIFPVLRS